jgi:site-specific DNA recombinase
MVLAIEKKMKATIYARVSTDDQDKEGTSLQTQLQACLKYCHDKGYQVTHKFTETYSGLTLDRPELTQLRNLLRTNNLDVIVIYCLDRLSRNATHGVILRDEFDKHHTVLESVTEDIDKSPLGEAITYLRGTFAQIEAEKIKELN